ncbi:MAG: hypothetical protein RQ754_09350 [Desulfuromonadales bacterium]|nr:hypothetical protein [Desulfuromonadales bacterium]
MRISDRYRMVFDAVSSQLVRMQQAEQEKTEGALECIANAVTELRAQLETVGEIPQIRLEQRLSPILLSVHALLDRARVLSEAEGCSAEAAAIWELEQQIYRLLNDL